MWTNQFWKDTAERAIRTGAQTLIGLLVAGATILTIDWAEAGAVIGTAMLASVLMSLMGSGIGDHESPSLLDGKWRRGKRVE